MITVLCKDAKETANEINWTGPLRPLCDLRS
jgi:hypothetical protein